MFYPGDRIGPYTLVSKLGRGGFGEVWLAERRTKFVTTKVAVKLPHEEQIDHEAIRAEATLWERASGHPNILPIIDADEYNGQVVIVSEYAPGGSLEQWLKKNGKMTVVQAVEMTIQILDGLEFLHSRSIIHRDLKPANILLQKQRPRLGDFGISRAMRTTMSSRSEHISGTFAYMSPEALDGKRSVQTDIWSAGVNLYQFLTGTLPFPQAEFSVLFSAILMREYEPLPDSIPTELRKIIAKALQKLPENRYRSADEMMADLGRFLKGYSPPAPVPVPDPQPVLTCFRCGATVVADARFCTKCGQKLLIDPEPVFFRSPFTLNNGKISKIIIAIVLWGFTGFIFSLILANTLITYGFSINFSFAPLGFLLFLFGEYSISPSIRKEKRIYGFMILFLTVSIGWLIFGYSTAQSIISGSSITGLTSFGLGSILGAFIAAGELICWRLPFRKAPYALCVIFITGLVCFTGHYFSGLTDIAAKDWESGLRTQYVIVQTLVLLTHAILFAAGRFEWNSVATRPKQ